MYNPSLEEVKALAQSGSGNLVPVYRSINADLETPVSAYMKVAPASLFFPVGKRDRRGAVGPLQLYRHRTLPGGQDRSG